MRIFRSATEAARPPLSVRSALPGFSRMCELGLSNKSDFNDFTPAGMNSDRGDSRFSGLVRQPLYVSCGAVSEQANIRKGRAYRMIRAKAAGCARANFALRASGTHRRTSRMHSGLRAGEALPHRDGEGASGAVRSQLRRPGGEAPDLRGCAARAGIERTGRRHAGACRKSVGRAKEGRGAGAFRCGPHLRTPQSRTGDRKGGAPDEFSDIRRRRERRRCVPAKPTGQAPRGRFVAGAGMPPAARGGDMPGRAESPSGARKRAAGREHSTAERISGRRNPARAIGKAAPRMNFPTSGEGGREDDASRQSRPDKLRAGGSLPEPECPPPHGAATCRGVPKVRQARERGPRGGSIPRRNASADAAIPHGRSERRRPG